MEYSTDVGTPYDTAGSAYPDLDILEELQGLRPGSLRITLLEDLLALQAGSVKIEKLTVLEERKAVNLRPTIHIFYYAPYGTGKSTLAQMLAEEYKTEVYTNTTLAGLVGSYRPRRGRKPDVIPGCAWTDKVPKLLILDEFSLSKRDEVQNAILRVLDPGKYARKLNYPYSQGYFRYDEKIKGLYFKITKRKGIELSTRVASLFLTMVDPRSSKEKNKTFYQALINRCIPFCFDEPTFKDLDILKGAFKFERNRYNPPKEVVISREDVLYIENFVKQYLRPYSVGVKRYLRTLPDCERVFAVTGKHHKSLYQMICDSKVHLSPK